MYGGDELLNFQRGFSNNIGDYLEAIEKAAKKALVAKMPPIRKINPDDYKLTVKGYCIRVNGSKVDGWNDYPDSACFGLQKLNGEHVPLVYLESTTNNCGILALSGLIWFADSKLLGAFEKLFTEEFGYSCLMYSTGGGQKELDKLLSDCHWKCDRDFYNQRSGNKCRIYTKLFHQDEHEYDEEDEDF